ncbi:hypothetical protein [uncultured Azohydromonas sp.]|uniref:hypothetical protein n=1 Tax=uncultured Azohydromonas sp. TaxID=487342 RepID=UPI002638CACF|nr:hypothetical protein [uncultured Azohydromonas sp.]
MNSMRCAWRATRKALRRFHFSAGKMCEAAAAEPGRPESALASRRVEIRGNPDSVAPTQNFGSTGQAFSPTPAKYSNELTVSVTTLETG